jgi:hypothetical protein
VAAGEPLAVNVNAPSGLANQANRTCRGVLSDRTCRGVLSESEILMSCGHTWHHNSPRSRKRGP